MFILAVLALSLDAQFSIADTDDFRATEINPAGLGYDNPNGLSIMKSHDDEFNFEDDYSLFINTEGLSYYLFHSNNDNHRLTTGNLITIGKNFNIGMSWDWTNSKFGKGDLGISMLYRPADFLSIAALSDNFSSETSDYTFGAAIRPLFFSSYFKDRFSVSCDIDWIEEDELSEPRFGVKTEFHNGLILGGSYNLEDETVGVNFGLRFGGTAIGTVSHMNKDNEVQNGNYYLSFNDKLYRSFIAPNKDNFYTVKTGSKIIDKQPVMKIGPFRFISDKSRTLHSLIKELEQLKEDDRIKGIVFKSNFSTSFANFLELRDAINDFKTSGKKVVFYFEGINNINYVFAASVADYIYLNPNGSVDLKGMAVSSPYFKDLLDKVGVEVKNFRSHPYKTAGNMFSETEMTDAEREAYSYLLEGYFQEFVNLIEAGRGGKLINGAEAVIDNGPYYVAQDAVTAGLVDALIYEDELQDKLKLNFGEAKLTKSKPQKMARTDWSEPKKDKIAIIYAVGSIHSGEGTPGKSIGSVNTAAAIRKARKDRSVKGILLRVNSGGGSALASDIIAREVKLCNEGKDKKPVVVSMGGAAASGGYYISAFADRIVAQPATITGSIGVVGMIPNFSGLYEKLGVNWSVVKYGEHADLGASHRSMSDDEAEIISSSIENVYDKFISVVAEGRQLGKEEVRKIAMGRIWTGSQAKDRGLVDLLGGMDVALEELKTLAKLEREIALYDYSGRSNKNEIDLGMLMNTFIEMPEELTTMKEISDSFKLYKNEKVLMLMPPISVD